MLAKRKKGKRPRKVLLYDSLGGRETGHNGGTKIGEAKRKSLMGEGSYFIGKETGWPYLGEGGVHIKRG